MEMRQLNQDKLCWYIDEKNTLEFEVRLAARKTMKNKTLNTKKNIKYKKNGF